MWITTISRGGGGVFERLCRVPSYFDFQRQRLRSVHLNVYATLRISTLSTSHIFKAACFCLAVYSIPLIFRYLFRVFSYSRTYFGFYRFVVKHGLRPTQEIKQTPYEPKPYNTPEMLGHKWQMDVKYVPRECNKGTFRKEWYYQYTIIDEATRERFLYPFKEKSGYSTAEFVKRAIVHFGYVPEIIQTDNGTEFTNPQWAKPDTVHILDKLLNRLHIKHQLIRVRTPRHNGKVERSHRSDQEAFYNHLTFTTYEELKEKMQAWNIRYNNRPHSQLRDKDGKRVWFTPLQKRAELLELLKENREKYRVRFLKSSAA